MHVQFGAFAACAARLWPALPAELSDVVAQYCMDVTTPWALSNGLLRLLSPEGVEVARDEALVLTGIGVRLVLPRTTLPTGGILVELAGGSFKIADAVHSPEAFVVQQLPGAAIVWTEGDLKYGNWVARRTPGRAAAHLRNTHWYERVDLFADGTASFALMIVGCKMIGGVKRCAIRPTGLVTTEEAGGSPQDFFTAMCWD